MPVKLHYNFKDVLRTPKLALSAKKIWLQFLGFLCGTVLYSALAYIAFIVSGYSASEVWHFYHFIPLPFGENLNLLSMFCIGMGVFLFTLSYLFAGTAVSKLTYEQLKGDEFYEIKRAVRFAFTEGKSVILAPITLAVGIALIILMGIILGLIGKIPWFGEIILLITSVPALFGGIFVVYLFAALFVSLMISAAVAATSNSDTFDTIFETFSTINDQSWRLATYETILLGCKVVGTSILAFVVGRAVALVSFVLGADFLMGAKFNGIREAALSYFTTTSEPFLYKLSGFFNFLGIDSLLKVPLRTPELPVPQAILGLIFGILLYFIVMIVLSYAGSMQFTGNTLIYLVLAKKKDDIELIKREEEEPEAIAETTEIIEETLEAPEEPGEGESPAG
jgi:hypothetical protein